MQASYLSHSRYNKLQVMGSSAESDQHNKRNLLPGIKSTTERTPTNRNNTSDMLPENNTGKDVEITERTQALKGTKQYRTPNNKIQDENIKGYTRQLPDQQSRSNNRTHPERESRSEPSRKTGNTTDEVEHIEIQRK